MAEQRLPSLGDRLNQARVASARQAFAPQPAIPQPQPEQPTALGGGVRAGFNELQALGGSALAAVGKATDMGGLEQWGAETAAKNFGEAQQYGRPDLERVPWREGGADVLPWLGYQAAKQIPQVVGGAAIGAATGGVGLGAAVAGRAAIGAGGMAAGRAAAGQAAKSISKQAMRKAYSRGAAGGLFGMGSTVGAGAMYNEAVERGDPTREDAIRALQLAPVYGAVEAVPQALIGKTLLKGGTASTIGRRVAGGIGMGAAAEGPTEAVQTAMENTFRPDLSTDEKTRRIVDAAITGAAVGGTFGGVGGVRQTKGAEPQEHTNDVLKNSIDEDLAPEAQAPPQPEQPFQGPQTGQGELFQPDGQAPARPFADLPPDQLVEVTERTLAMAADPQTPPEQRAQAEQALGQLQQEIRTRQDEAPASELSDAQLDQQAEVAEINLTQDASPERLNAAQARLQEIQSERTQRQEAAQTTDGPTLPGIEPLTREAQSQSQKEQSDARKQEKREIRLARQAIRNVAEEATPSKEAERLGLTPFTAREFEARVDATRTRLRDAAAVEQEARTRQEAIAQDPAATQETRKQADKTLKDAQKQLRDATKEANKATQEVRLRERVVQRVEAAQGDINALESQQDAVDAADTPDPAQTDPLEAITSMQRAETPSRRRRRWRNMREQGLTAETRFRVQREGAEGDPIEITWPEMLDEPTLTQRIRTEGLADTQQEARQMARRMTSSANNGGANLTESMQQMGVQVEPVAPDPPAALETPMLQTEDVPQARRTGAQGQPGPQQASEPRTGIGAPTTPAKAAMSPQAQLDRQQNEPERTVADVQAAAPETSPTQLIEAPSTAKVTTPKTPQESQDTVGKVVSAIVKNAKAMMAGDYLSMAPRVREELLKWFDVQTMIVRFSNQFSQPYLRQLRELDNKKKNVIGYFAPLATARSEEFSKLKGEVQEKIMEIMELTAYDVSYARSWSEHEHLHGRKDEAFLKSVHKKATTLYDQIERNAGRKVLDDFADLNRSMALENQIRRLHEVLAVDFELQNRKDFDQVVGRRGYDMIMRRQIREPKNIVDALVKDRAGLLQVAEQLIQQKNVDAARAGISQAEQERLLVMSDTLSQVTAQVKDEAQFDNLIPYFHKGRFGDYRVMFRLPTAQDADGNKVPNTQAEEAVADALAAQGITGIGIQQQGPDSNVLMKFETQGQADAAFGVAERLAQGGFIIPDTLRKGGEEQKRIPTPAAHEFKEGLINQILTMTSNDPNVSMQAEKEKMQRIVEKYFLETTAANSSRRVMTHRRNVQGYDKNMHRSFVHRWEVGITDTANAITASPRAKVYRGMRDEMKQAGRPGEPDPNRTYVQNDLINEMRARDQEVDIKPNSLTGAIRAINHAWYLGMSPAYMMMTVAHVPIITLPKLGAVFGFSKASNQLLTAAPEAGRVLRVLIKNSMNLRQFGEATFTNLSPEVLQREFLEFDDQGRATPESQEFVKMLLELAETATIDMGGAMHELGRTAEGRNESKLDHVLRVYGAPGFYSEIYSRLVTGIATYRMYKERGKTGEDLINTTANMIHETMLDYSQTNIGRRLQAGGSGFAGPITPIVTAFQSYSFQVLGMIYREYHKMYQHNEPDPARRAEARKFLAGHLAAVTVFAGTMGLPFATAASRAVESLANLLFVDDNDEPLDLKTAYQNYLTDTFGRDVGEVIANGLPWAFGMDVSGRLGEQDILPFSRVMGDRRFLLDSAGTMDAVADSAMRGLGAPVGIPTSLAEAVPQLLNGNLIGASATGAPVAISNLFKSYKMSQDGYTNSNGQQLGITPTSYDILLQATGIQPATKARESAAANTVRTYEMRTNVRKNVIRRQVQTAMEAGDGEAMRKWLAEAQAFDLANPGTPVIPTLAQTLTARYEKSAIARVTGLPRGSDFKNPAIYRMTRFTRE